MAVGIRTVSRGPDRIPVAPLEIGTRVEMFVDDYLIASMRGGDFVPSPPERREVVLTTDRPWEGPASAYFTVIRDGSTVRLYYRGYCPADLSLEQVTCVAESRDGIAYDRPTLGLFDFRGSKRNNIVHVGKESHNFGPFLDANPAAPPAERYKALGGIESRLFAFCSPDGLHWRKLREEPVITDGAFDSLNTAFWDSVAKVYRCYSRNWSGGGYTGYRGIQSCTSTDFVKWTKPVPNRYSPDAGAQHLYTNATRPCPGAEHHLLSFPMRFVPDRTRRQGYAEPGVSDALFMTSRDGTTWDRRFAEAWLRPGRDEFNWTQRSNMPAAGIVQTRADEFSMYASEHYDWPDHRLRRLSIRKHGFASVHGGAAVAEMTTKVILLAAKKLVLNYSTSAAGSISVEVRNPAGVPVRGLTHADCIALYGDDLDRDVLWRGGSNLGSLVGKPIALSFRLQEANLFALRFSD